MKKIRIGNDFVFNWAIERGGLPEDLSSVLDAKLTVSVFGKKQDVPFTVSGNIITVEFTPQICNVIGSYNLLFTYILPDLTLSDDDRKCAVDVDAFQIVAKTAQADDPSEFTVTSDMAIAFKGDKGDSAYQVWLDAGNTGTEEDYFAYLRQPAIDAAQSANEAADSALTATQEATTAASLADTARLAIQDDLGLKLDKSSVKQVLGASTTDVMSQKAVTDELAKKQEVLVDYVHSGNLSFRLTGFDYLTGIFTAPNHGLVNGDLIAIIPEWDSTKKHNDIENVNLGKYLPGSFSGQTLRVIEATSDTFRTVAQYGNAEIIYTHNENIDFNRFHIERPSISGLIFPVTEKDVDLIFTGYKSWGWYGLAPRLLSTVHFVSKGLNNVSYTSNFLTIGFIHSETSVRLSGKFPAIFSRHLETSVNNSGDNTYTNITDSYAIGYDTVTVKDYMLRTINTSFFIANGSRLKIVKR